MSPVVHTLPVNDLIAHEDTGDDCPCGPDTVFVSGGKVIVHHSLDGRELREPDQETDASPPDADAM